MRCNCCGRMINPDNDVRKTHAMMFDANTPFVAAGVYGPVCAVRLGLVKPKRPRQQGKFTIFGKSATIKIDDGQIDFFEVVA